MLTYNAWKTTLSNTLDSSGIRCPRIFCCTDKTSIRAMNLNEKVANDLTAERNDAYSQAESALACQSP